MISSTSTLADNRIEPPHEADFVQMIQNLRSERAVLFDLVQRLTASSCQIKPMQPNAETDTLDKEPACVVDHLWAEIRLIRLNNSQLERCVVHLQNIIGG